MYIPRHWLFDTKHSSNNNNNGKGDGKKLLILEADVSTDESSVWSLLPQADTDNDLDLYEVAQGFTQLSNMVATPAHGAQHSHEPQHDVLRVLLVDTSTVMESASGTRTRTVRDHVRELGLADVVVDCRAPLILSLTSWLNQHSQQQQQQQQSRRLPSTKRRGGWFGGILSSPLSSSSSSSEQSTLKPVVLETPEKAWFVSLSEECQKHGYEVMDHYQAQQRFGSLRDIPFLVYQRTTADTIHTVHQYVSKQRVKPSQVCALCPEHTPLLQEQGMMRVIDGVTHLSSTDLYDRILRWVRHRALDGHSAQQIQDDLDHELSTILELLKEQRR